ncbi:hypothetical protein [Acidimangrovimonas pyrenivorans]|uniref:Flagellar hook-length control protein FliK n=1 Tax=Acidimangrovimonas pyrenivorans TaxID=2030798 RepID=A0ABV7ANF8_9RHOB
MSVGGASGPAGAAAFPSTTLSLRALARAGWISGRVLSILDSGDTRVATALGTVTLPADAGRFEPGQVLRLMLDAGSGRIRVAGETGQQPAARSTEPPPAVPAAGPALSAALAGLAPVTAAALPLADPALAAVFPQANSAGFALIAALFPQILQDGTLSELARRRRRARYGARNRAGRAAEKALVGFTAGLGADPRRWQMPIFGAEAEYDTDWSRPAPEQTDPPRDTLVLEMELPFCGPVRITAERVGDGLTLQVSSEGPLPAALAERLAGRATAIAAAWGAALTLIWQPEPAA